MHNATNEVEDFVAIFFGLFMSEFNFDVEFSFYVAVTRPLPHIRTIESYPIKLIK